MTPQLSSQQLEWLQRKTLIVGLGKSGQAALHFLMACGVELEAVDTRTELSIIELQTVFSQLNIGLGPLDATQLIQFERIVLSPGISRWDPAIEEAAAAGVEVVGDVELFARLTQAPVVAVTGSNGKSTVTTLVAEMAAAAGQTVIAGGNLGIPVLEMLQQKIPELYVVELSSFQLETTESLKTVAATVLNISADHMDRYRDLDHYAEIKMKICREATVAVLPLEDPWVESWLERSESRLQQMVGFGLNQPAEDQFGVCQNDGELWLCRGEAALLPVSEMKMVGQHGWRNALAALALGEAAGLPLESMLSALKRFTGLPHRTEWVTEQQGVRWINDSKGTNVGATEAAIAGLDDAAGEIVWIAGGQGKGGDFSPLRSLAERSVRSAILMGEDREQIAAAIEGVTVIHRVENMEEAVAVAANDAVAGDTVLLSPACASFDQFSGFEARGEAFRQAVVQQLGSVQ